MNTTEILEYLAPHDPERGGDRRLSLPGDLVRCKALGLVAVGSDRDEDSQTNALINGLHWHRRTMGGQGPLRLLLGRAPFTPGVLQTLGTLIAVLGDKVEVRVEVDNEAVRPHRPDFAEAKPDWMQLLAKRDTAAGEPPSLVTELQQRVKASSFRWYRTLSVDSWSGRVDGLRVCEVRDGEVFGVLRVGAPGKDDAESRVRLRFKEILRQLTDSNSEELRFDAGSTELAARIVDAVANDRGNGVLADCEREHLLEAKILRGAVRVDVDEKTLQPVEQEHPFQFPTLWSSGERGDARYLDVLMRADEVPWAVELKVPAGGQGQYYRSAIKQAVLYREFIRAAKKLHPWFVRRGLDPTRCEAALVLPFHGRHQDRNREEISWLARLFGVSVATFSES